MMQEQSTGTEVTTEPAVLTPETLQAAREEVLNAKPPEPPVPTPALVAEKKKIKTGIVFTKDGPRETFLLTEPGNPEAKVEKGFEPLPHVEFQGYPKGWKTKHLQGFHAICLMVFEIKKQKDRQVPVLRLEVEQHVEKQVVKELEKMGVIGSQLIQLMNKGGRMGGRVVVWLTPYGRAVEEHIYLQVKAAQEAQATAPRIEVELPEPQDENELREVLDDAQEAVHQSVGISPEQLTGGATTATAVQAEAKS